MKSGTKRIKTVADKVSAKIIYKPNHKVNCSLVALPNLGKASMSKGIFIDTNIMLDFLGDGKRFYEPIAKIATLAKKA
ncbi:hypothetical protein [Galbibacter sp. PAP.153]|uniref:hypothetical protein n=1 Tax=Galbibacter sp. PAP.153 TaxID=3104623 RepID=UPI00300994D6